MSEIDQQFVEYVVKSLVGNPDAIEIKRTIDEKGVLLELTVDPEDLGRVIGKRGATAQSLRTLLIALGTKNDARYNLKIIDNGVAPPAAPAAVADDASAQPTTDSSDSDAPAPDQTVDDEPVTDTPQESSTDKLGDEPEEDLELGRKEAAGDRLARTRAELSDLDDLDI
jgi:predicted RNA-binding protein YlqC (UPF0109 family)